MINGFIEELLGMVLLGRIVDLKQSAGKVVRFFFVFFVFLFFGLTMCAVFLLLPSSVIGASSKPKAFAPILPISVCTKLHMISTHIPRRQSNFNSPRMNTQRNQPIILHPHFPYQHVR